MTELLSFLEKLLPLWAVTLVAGFGYLLILLKRASDRFLDIAKQQSDYMKDRVDVVDKSTGIFTRTIDQQEKEIKHLQDQLQRLGTDLLSTRQTDARLSIQELTVLAGEIERLSSGQEALLKLIGRTSVEVASPSGESAGRLEGPTVREDIRRAIRARDLSIYPVLILKRLGADALVNELRHAGYAASIYESEFHLENEQDHQEGIWLGAMIPPGNAIEIIQIARRHWPHLKYVHLSTDGDGPEDTHYTMFIGGSSAAATGHLRCDAWKDSDFRSLSASMSFDDFHSYVRSLYRKPMSKPPAVTVRETPEK